MRWITVHNDLKFRATEWAHFIAHSSADSVAWAVTESVAKSNTEPVAYSDPNVS